MDRGPELRNYFNALGWCYSLYRLLLLQYGTYYRSTALVLPRQVDYSHTLLMFFYDFTLYFDGHHPFLLCTAVLSSHFLRTHGYKQEIW